jgi:hypothetical protein
LEIKNSSSQGKETKIVNHYSDSIIISYSKTEEACLFHIISELIFFYATALQRNFLLRGAIICDKLYHDENIIFGPALVKAYEMEKNLAIYPRIILDKNTLINGKKDIIKRADKPDHLKSIENLISIDFDGLYYINFFDGLNYIFGDKDSILIFFKALRQIIIDMEGSIKKDISIYSKYLWLKTNYNIILKKYKNKYCNDKHRTESPELNKYLNETKEINQGDKNG